MIHLHTCSIFLCRIVRFSSWEVWTLTRPLQIFLFLRESDLDLLIAVLDKQVELKKSQTDGQTFLIESRFSFPYIMTSCPVPKAAPDYNTTTTVSSCQYDILFQRCQLVLGLLQMTHRKSITAFSFLHFALHSVTTPGCHFYWRVCLAGLQKL